MSIHLATKHYVNHGLITHLYTEANAHILKANHADTNSSFPMKATMYVAGGGGGG